MPPACSPANEAARLDALSQAQILDTPSEPQYDNLTELAALVCKAPISLVSLVAKDRQWSKANIGFDMPQLPRGHAFCGHVVQLGSPIVILDAKEDPRFCDSPLVLEPPHIRFYAGCPIIVPYTDLCLGTVCVMDRTPREHFPEESLQALSLIARQAAELIQTNIKLSAERCTMYQVVSKVSQELMVPLNSIIGATNVLQKKWPADNDVQDILPTVIANAQQNSKVVSSITDFAALQAKSLRLEEKPFDLRGCIERMFRDLSKRPNFHALDVSYEMPQDLEVTGDCARLEQILANLLDNAVKFTMDGSVHLVVHSTKIADFPEYEELRFEVRDTGIGIPASKAHMVFHPFSQVDQPNGRRHSGVGLGLAICRSLCEAMGGNIWLDSVVGQGTSFFFTVRLPVRHVPPPACFAGKRVLVLDFEEAEFSVLNKHCTSLGLLVTHSTSPPEAVELLAKDQGFDAAFCTSEALDTSWTVPPTIPWILVGPMSQLTAALPLANLSPASLFVYTPIMRIQLQQQLQTLWDNLPSSLSTHSSLEFSELLVSVVDDNRVSRIVMMEFLRRLGCSVDLYANGAEVLAAVTQQTYDIIFMDVEMPVMDGLTATRRLRRLNANVFIVAVTADTSDDMRTQCILSGMDEFLEKPVRFDSVEQLVRRYIREAPRVGKRANLLSPGSSGRSSTSSFYRSPRGSFPASPPRPTSNCSPRRRSTRFADSDGASTVSFESVVVFYPHRPAADIIADDASPRRNGASLRHGSTAGLLSSLPRALPIRRRRPS